MKHNAKIVSVLDIGSNSVRMGVYQNAKGRADRLDFLEHPLHLGHEVFATGRIGTPAIRELSTALRGFSQVMKEYGVNEYRAFATTALREAENRAYVLDQLHTQNSLTVEILEDGGESALVFAQLLQSPLLCESALLAYIGTGSLGLAVSEGHVVTQTGSITLGFLKLSEILRDVEDQTTHFHKVLEEYVETRFRRFRLWLNGRKFAQLLLTGRELDTIARLCGAQEKTGVYVIDRGQLTALYDRAKNLHASVLARQLTLTEEAADQLLPMLAIYLRMLELTQAQQILAPRIHIMDSMARQMLLPDEKVRYEATVRESAAACARETGKGLQIDLPHAQRVREYSILLFNKLKKLHGISGKRLLLLECAALLHEAGDGVNAKNPSLATYDLAKQAYLFGLKEEETALIAEIARFGSLRRVLNMRDLFPAKQRLMIDKLGAILILADALDESHRGKLADCKLRLEEDRLAITARGREETHLEQWAVREAAGVFEEVFGVQPVLTNKSSLLT